MNYKVIEKHRCFNGTQWVLSHPSDCIQADMRVAVYMPPSFSKETIPVLYWLSGLTCSEQNFITKAGAQRVAAELGMAIVVPDTTPRHLNIPGDKDNDYIGEGAGMYVNATQKPWFPHYQLYDYISQELPLFIQKSFAVDKNKQGIFGHSMGGHGALVIGMRNPNIFKSLSALAPICAPTKTDWARHTLQAYLGQDENTWSEYDACEIVKKLGWGKKILIDQGSDDTSLPNLCPDLFEKACRQANVDLTLRWQAGYGHNYYFVASFIAEHLKFHAQQLV